MEFETKFKLGATCVIVGILALISFGIWIVIKVMQHFKVI